MTKVKILIMNMTKMEKGEITQEEGFLLLDQFLEILFVAAAYLFA